MSHPFEYQKPTTEQAAKMTVLSTYFRDVYDDLLMVAPSAERTIAIRKLQEARMWANVAILGITL